MLWSHKSKMKKSISNQKKIFSNKSLLAQLRRFQWQLSSLSIMSQYDQEKVSKKGQMKLIEINKCQGVWLN